MPTDDLRAGYAEQQRRAARATTAIGALVALVAFPAWAVFDELVLPAQAPMFFRVRMLFEVAILIGQLALRSERIGGRWPEQTSFVLIALPQVAISLMIPRSGDRLGPYLLGLSLVIFASAFLIVWRWHPTVLLVALTAATISWSHLVAPTSAPTHEIATVGFYLGTAGAIAIAAQLYRHCNGWQRFVVEAALEGERVRNAALVEELDQISREDALTGVGNRRAWEQRTVNELLRAARSGAAVSMILCDLDNFKSVNDTHGHAVGDRVLRVAAALLTDRARATDVVIRLGGDEFCVLCPDTELDGARSLARDIADLARTTVWPGDAQVTFSIGVAEARPGDVDPDEVLGRADLALYDAKTMRDTVRIR